MGKAFSNMSNETTDGSNLMIVDGLNLAFRFKHANKKEFSVEYFNLISHYKSHMMLLKFLY